MSDNIDYAELDKAVNEAIKNRSTTTKTTTKPVARPAVQRPRGANLARRSLRAAPSRPGTIFAVDV